jgi:hypothetical protein
MNRPSSAISLACRAAILAFALGPLARADDPSSAAGVDYFEKHIRPLLAARCYSCHSTRAGKREGGLLLDSRAGWTAGGDGGPVVVPSNADGSRLIQAVRYADPELQMPPDKPLPADAIARLEHWVRMGAHDPRDGTDSETAVLENPADPIAGRDHWAFRPLADSRIPENGSADWPRSPVDAFVLAALDTAGLKPAPDADRRTLARRIYIQLIGIPPTPDQLAAFVSDERSDGLERLVDELLSSPRFGERWGRHWLDLARYADSNGLDENFLFREAWRYRNWVLDAVNADLSFDRFLTEQIAGDLLPYETVLQRDRQRIAAGFLVVGPKVLLGNDARERRMDVADEQLDTIGRSVLGMTLGCARCHDHKFDPVPTADYYGLAGILTSTQVMEQRYMLNEQRLMEQLVGLGEDGEALDAAYEDYWREAPKRREKHKQAKSALELLKKDDLAEFKKFAEKHSEAVAEGVLDEAIAIEKRKELQQALVARLQEAIGKPLEIPSRAMVPSDVDQPADESIRLAGQFDRLGDSVPRGFLRVVSDKTGAIPPGRSGRLELSAWLTDSQHGAGQLAARVLANRIWYHLLGRGIVRTVDNFGRTGESPTHPQLLDYLAGRLLASGWSVKELVREIVLSRTFALSSRHDDAAHAIDPDNRWLWRAHRRRVEPEVLRDAMLAVAGELDLTPMKSSVWYLGDQATAVGDNKVRRRTDFPCRSVYLPVIRNDLPELFDVFDFADPHLTTGMRPQTMVATQGLFLLNDESVMAAAEAMARRLLAEEISGGVAERIDRMFELATGTPAAPDERQALQQFLDEIASRDRSAEQTDGELRAWTVACQAVFASSRFQVLE